MNSEAFHSTDVVVVGAGLSGLAAADQLVKEGYEVIIIEGRDRVGGRIKSVEVAGVQVDAGATWIAPNHEEMHLLVERLKTEIVPQFHTGKGVISLGGRVKVESPMALAPWALMDIARIMSELQRMADTVPMDYAWECSDVRTWDRVSFGHWLRKKHVVNETRKFMEMIAMVHWGAGVDDLSLYHVVRYIKTLGGLEQMLAVEGGDQQDRVVETMQGLVERYAEDIGARVITGSPAGRVTTVGNRVIVETTQATIEARFAIVATAPSHRSALEFEPRLPEHHYGLARSWRLGSLSKAFVAYDRPFWRDRDLSGESMSDDDTAFLTFDVSPETARPGILMVFCKALGFDGHDRDERIQLVVRHLVNLYGAEARQYIDYADFSWGNDHFAPGGPNPALAPGTWSMFGQYLREPVGLLHWAGSETADRFAGTMNGAILSGQRAAAEVAQRLAK